MEKPLRQPDPGTLTAPERKALRIIETLGHVPGRGPQRLACHLDRMARSAAALGFPFDRARAEALLTAAGQAAPLRLRLTLAADGGLGLTSGPLAPVAAEWRVMLSERRVDAADPWLRHKTTRRALYDETRAALPPGVDEVLFLNGSGALCEGTITNVFVAREGLLLTPPLSDGVLPGILRAELLRSGRARVRRLTGADLDGDARLYVGNALRGLIPARLAVRG